MDMPHIHEHLTVETELAPPAYKVRRGYFERVGLFQMDYEKMGMRGFSKIWH